MTKVSHSPHPLLTGTSLGLLALLSIGPLLAEPRSLSFLEPYSSTIPSIVSLALVLFVMGLTLLVRARLDQREEPRATAKILLFALLAALMTWMHWIEVDNSDVAREWQKDSYERILNHEYDTPHNYRPLPYGFTRLLERITHDWTFAFLSYRWYFTFWFLWASYRLARRYLSPNRALLTLVPLVLLYPVSILRYMGQLTDPLSHALFVLSFLFLLEDRVLALAAVLFLGVMAKETVAIVAPAYLACYWRRGGRAWLMTAGLGAVCVAAFLATRVPLGWRLGSYENINGAGLMIGTNLGLGEPLYERALPLWEHYLHVFLFVGIFIPPIVCRWRRIDPHLRALALVVVPLLLLSNVCFGWLYESRNYMPLVPLLATMALPPARPAA
jgi:hypothetical protein